MAKKDAVELSFDQLKTKHGEAKVKQVTLNSSTAGELEVIVKIPDRNVLGEYLTWNDKSVTKAHKIVIEKCLLTKHEEVDADDELYTGCAIAIISLMPIGSFNVKN